MILNVLKFLKCPSKNKKNLGLTWYMYCFWFIFLSFPLNFGLKNGVLLYKGITFKTITSYFFLDCEQWIHRYCLDSLEELCPKKKKNRPPSSVFNIPRPHAGKLPMNSHTAVYSYTCMNFMWGWEEAVLVLHYWCMRLRLNPEPPWGGAH